MSVLDKSFLEPLLNLPKETFLYFDSYEAYMEKRVTSILNCKLLSHIVAGGGSDITVCLMYQHEDKYLLLEFWKGSCGQCNLENVPYNDIITSAIEKIYVTTVLKDMEKYYFNKLRGRYDETEIYQTSQLYTMYPECLFTHFKEDEPRFTKL